MSEPEPEGAGPMEGVDPEPASVSSPAAAAAEARLARAARQEREEQRLDCDGNPCTLAQFIPTFGGTAADPPQEWLAAPVHLEPAAANPSAVSSAANNPPPAATDDSISAGALVAGALLTTRSPSLCVRSLCVRSLCVRSDVALCSGRCDTWLSAADAVIRGVCRRSPSSSLSSPSPAAGALTAGALLAPLCCGRAHGLPACSACSLRALISSRHDMYNGYD